jgi:hypothetical protein
MICYSTFKENPPSYREGRDQGEGSIYPEPNYHNLALCVS